MCLNPYYTGIHLHEPLGTKIAEAARVLILIILEYIYIDRREIQSVAAGCLNPYYTGIHLHIISESRQRGKNVLILIILEYIYIFILGLRADKVTCLNPYYTGIHLHAKSARENIALHFCLNPYYTGIHLHKKRDTLETLSVVLILIILEYIYMNYDDMEGIYSIVLILIILEYIYIRQG